MVPPAGHVWQIQVYLLKIIRPSMEVNPKPQASLATCKDVNKEWFRV